MCILTLVDGWNHAYLTQLFGVDGVEAVRDLHTALHRLQTTNVRALVLDPLKVIAAPAERECFGVIARHFPELTVAYYAALRADAAAALTELSRTRHGEVLLAGVDDRPQRVLSLLGRSMLETRTRRLADELIALTEIREARLVRAVREAFAAPARVRVLDDLAAIVGVTGRTFIRLWHQADLRRPKHLILASRTVWAHGWYQLREFSLPQIAHLVGLTDPATLSQQCKRLLGLPPRDAFKMDTELFDTLLVESLIRGEPAQPRRHVRRITEGRSTQNLLSARALPAPPLEPMWAPRTA